MGLRAELLRISMRIVSQRGLWRGLITWALAGVLLLATVWAVSALLIDVRITWLRLPLAGLYLIAVIAVLMRTRSLRRKLVFIAGAFLLVLGWWWQLKPSNSRDWQPDVAVLPFAEVAGQRITIHNIRNCDYRTATDYTVRHYDQTFDLEQLHSVDLYMVYWGSPAMAHMMVSFGFAGDAYLCFSIETRKEKGEGYSAIKGLFRQFELTCVVADERDLVRLRTNYRAGEEAYLFRLQATPAQAGELFLDYVRQINALYHQPQWYQAVTANCSTSIRSQRAAQERVPWDWRMLANGYADTLLYQRGDFVTNIPLTELKARGHINQRARAADQSADFSRQIRQGVPGIEP